MVKRVIFATGNKDKVREAEEILGALGLTVISQKEAGIVVDVDENGTTFAENAMLKAEAVAGQNRPDEALGYVNQVRSRAGVSPYLTSDGIKDKIVNERRWEFACEETLYYDELRCGTWKDFRFAAGNGLAEPWGTTEYRYSWGGDAYYHWPIPSKEREMNTNLVQNEGWLK